MVSLSEKSINKRGWLAPRTGSFDMTGMRSDQRASSQGVGSVSHKPRRVSRWASRKLRLARPGANLGVVIHIALEYDVHGGSGSHIRLRLSDYPCAMPSSRVNRMRSAIQRDRRSAESRASGQALGLPALPPFLSFPSLPLSLPLVLW